MLENIERRNKTTVSYRRNIFNLKLICFKNTESNGINSTHLELSFEYLFSKEKFQWITINSEQVDFINIIFY